MLVVERKDGSFTVLLVGFIPFDSVNLPGIYKKEKRFPLFSFQIHQVTRPIL